MVYSSYGSMNCWHFFLQNEELNLLAEEARLLKDEMDIMKHTTDKVVSTMAGKEAWALIQYKDRLIYVWRFPC